LTSATASAAPPSAPFPSFPCSIYPMDSPGGYQLVGRTLPIWNTFGRAGPFTAQKPWLLEFFDQVGISWDAAVCCVLYGLCASWHVACVSSLHVKA
jgi:hypothetical protein